MYFDEVHWNLLKVGIKRLALGVQATEDSVLIGGQGSATFTYTKKAAKEVLEVLERPAPPRFNRRGLRLLESYAGSVAAGLRDGVIPAYTERIKAGEPGLDSYLKSALDKQKIFEYILDELKKELKK